MGIQIDGSANTISGLAVGGLPNGSISSDDIASNAVTVDKLASTLDLSSNTVTLPNTSVTAGMLASTLDISGKTVTLPNTSVTAGMLASTLDLTGKTVTLPSGTGGKILQVATAVKTDVFSFTSTSFTDVTGLSVNLTPSNTNNTIILMATVYMSARGNVSAPYAAFGKGGSVITASTGDAAGSRPRVTSAYYNGDYGDNNVIYDVLPMLYSETAGATTQQTYSVMVRQGGAITMYVNRSIIDRDTSNYEARGISSLIAMEVSA